MYMMSLPQVADSFAVTNIPTFELLCVAKIHLEICAPSTLNFHVLDHRRTLKRNAFVSKYFNTKCYIISQVRLVTRSSW